MCELIQAGTGQFSGDGRCSWLTNQRLTIKSEGGALPGEGDIQRVICVLTGGGGGHKCHSESLGGPARAYAGGLAPGRPEREDYWEARYKESLNPNCRGLEFQEKFELDLTDNGETWMLLLREEGDSTPDRERLHQPICGLLKSCLSLRQSFQGATNDEH